MSKTITGITTASHAPVERVKGHAPVAAGQSRFMLVTEIVAGGLTVPGVTGKSEPSLRSARQRTRIGFQEANLRFVLIVTAGDFAHD